MTPNAIEITKDEMRADMEWASEYERLAHQRCVDCKHAHWLHDYDCTLRFMSHVDDPHEIGACIIDIEPIIISGITKGDTALSADCDYWAPVDR